MPPLWFGAQRSPYSHQNEPSSKTLDFPDFNDDFLRNLLLNLMVGERVLKSGPHLAKLLAPFLTHTPGHYWSNFCTILWNGAGSG